MVAQPVGDDPAVGGRAVGDQVAGDQAAGVEETEMMAVVRATGQEGLGKVSLDFSSLHCCLTNF